jgi:nucleotide-binding universal stress UspA family protein
MNAPEGGLQMFKKLLVPLDGTAEAAVALPPARALAQQLDAELSLVRVVPPGLDPADGKAAEAALYLQRVAGELAKGGLAVDTQVRVGGDAANEIMEAACTGGADLVVMATRARGNLQRVLMGSVMEQVLAKGPAPVLLLRPGGHRVTCVQTLLVPVDGTPGAALALGTAVPLAQTTGAKIVLLQVVLPGAYYSAGGWNLVDLGSDEEALAAAQSYVAGLAGRLERAGVAAEGRATLGRVSDTIVETAAGVGADFIVMSTHALTGPVRTLLGSTADEVAQTARCPVLLIRQGARPAVANTPVAGRLRVSAAAEEREVPHGRASDGW